MPGFITRWGNSHFKPFKQQNYRGYPHRSRHDDGDWGDFGHKPKGPAPAAKPSLTDNWGQGGSFSFNGRPPSSTQPAPQRPGTGPGGVGYFSNLENNLPLPQGWQRRFAQPTSISSMITNLLYQSRQDPQDYWNRFFGMGRSTNQTFGGGTTGGSSQMPARGGNFPRDDRQNSSFGANQSSPSQQQSSATRSSISQSTFDALSLADAYFSPKRLELAYELGDMETDMRRLAVNLGRQVDDPVLQAKLYKEAMRSVRTLDSEQNSFSLQMVEQRRKEDIQNQQFYDQLALERQKTSMQDDQFYASLELQRRQVGLQAKQLNK